MDLAQLERLYDASIQQGFHPGRGNKTGAEAVAAHEIGHRLTDAVADKMGLPSVTLDSAAATRIVKEAMKRSGFKGGIVQFERTISQYATQRGNAEAIAEACTDVYCNGNRAKSASKAIMAVVDSYLLNR